MIVILAVGRAPIPKILDADELSSSMQFSGNMETNLMTNFSTNCS